jgi:hypothetical protein
MLGRMRCLPPFCAFKMRGRVTLNRFRSNYRLHLARAVRENTDLLLTTTQMTIPNNYTEAMNSADSAQWKLAMSEEFESLQTNKTWRLINANSCTKRRLPCLWVYRVKLLPDGQVDRFKARLVVKGCSQKFDKSFSDYDETYAPVAQSEIVRTLLAV